MKQQNDQNRRNSQRYSPSNGEYQRQRQAAEEKAALRKKEQKKMKRRENLRVTGGRLLVFLIIFLILAAIAATVIFIAFCSTPDAPKTSGDITYYYGGKEVRKQKAEGHVTIDGAYFCFNDLSEYLGMAESGNASEMKFIIRGEPAKTSEGQGDEEYIVFLTDGKRVIVNGQEIKLEIPNLLEGDEVWVAIDFIRDYMSGLSVSYDKNRAVLRVARIADEQLSTKDTTVYLPVSFRLSRTDPMEQADKTGVDTSDLKVDIGTIDVPDVWFPDDLSMYEMYMNPQGDMRDAFLVLVNSENRINDGSAPADLATVTYGNMSGTVQLREYAMMSLEALFTELRSAGYFGMMVDSGYRDYTYQSNLFESYVQKEMAASPSLTRAAAEALVSRYSARPGYSEHQTGLAVDMDNAGTLTVEFADTDEYRWLDQNAWKFGFILRYPEGKEDITGIQFEPWHYRFVGRYHAYKIHESGMCLEEYLKDLNSK